MSRGTGNSGEHGRHWGETALLCLLALFALLPFALMLWTAQKSCSRVDDAYYYLSQQMPEWQVRRKMEIDARPLRVALLNSTVVSAATAALCVVFGLMAGYAFAKKRFRGKTILFDLVVISMGVPAALLMMPMFRLTVGLGIYNSLAALILPFAVSGFSIAYLRYAISAVPDSVVESARLDGLSELGVIFRIVLPMVWPSVVTLGVVQFLTSWNSFVLPQAVVNSERHYTVSILLGRLVPDFPGLMWNDIMVLVIAAIIPVVTLYLAFHRSIQGALTSLAEDRSSHEGGEAA